MKRRQFIAGLGSAAAAYAWPLAAQAQQVDRVRRIGVLMGFDENDPEAKGWLSAFTQGLAESGWTDTNLRMHVRWAGGNVDQIRTFAREVVDLQCDVILSQTTPVTAALRRETQKMPIIFVMVGDPVGDGFVASVPRPGGNITGFGDAEQSISGKWLELLMEIAPRIKRIATMFNPDVAPGRGSYFMPSVEAAARSLKVGSIAAPVHSDAEIESVMTSLGREPDGGLVAIPDGFVLVHRAPIILLAARNNVPAVYWDNVFARDGGLLGYGPDRVDLFRRSASYVDRILRGAKPSDLPVQVPIKFEMTLNVKSAKALGLTIPQTLLATADEVIQ
jgi:putative tryptophan/tyrosine transport system substrate-binding protein